MKQKNIQDWIGLPYGSRATSTGGTGWVYLLAPTPELWTRARPFAGLAIGQIVYGVVYAAARSDLPPDCPPGYAELARSCWVADPNARPTFSEITVTLRGLLQGALVAAREAAGGGRGGGGGAGGQEGGEVRAHASGGRG
jgi:hypothetical protein